MCGERFFCRDENTGRSIYIKDIPDDSETQSQAVLQYRLQAYYELAKAVNATDRLGLRLDSPASPLVIITTQRKHLVTKSRRDTA